MEVSFTGGAFAKVAGHDAWIPGGVLESLQF